MAMSSDIPKITTTVICVSMRDSEFEHIQTVNKHLSSKAAMKLLQKNEKFAHKLYLEFTHPRLNMQTHIHCTPTKKIEQCTKTIYLRYTATYSLLKKSSDGNKLSSPCIIEKPEVSTLLNELIVLSELSQPPKEYAAAHYACLINMFNGALSEFLTKNYGTTSTISEAKSIIDLYLRTHDE
jgi:hypothetical protein